MIRRPPRSTLFPSRRSSDLALRRLSRLFGGAEVLAEARSLTDNPAALQALDELSAIYDALCAAGWGAYVGFDLGLVHQLDYYTGMVFCGYVEGSGHVVVTGGRYDALMGKFGRSAPATGFAVDVAGVAGALPVQEVKTAHKLVHYEAGCLGAAMKLQCAAGAGEIELSCCENEEESRRLAHQKGIPTLVVLTASGVREESV